MKKKIIFTFLMFLVVIVAICFTTAGAKARTSYYLDTQFRIFGDVNFDGLVDLSDYFIVSNDAANFVTGSTITDLNGDGITNLSDVLIVHNLL